MPLPPWMGRWGGPLRLLSQGSCLFFFFEELRSSCFSAGAAERCGGFSPPPGRSRSSAGGTGGAAGQGRDFPRRENPTRGEGTPGADNPHCTAPHPFRCPYRWPSPPRHFPHLIPTIEGVSHSKQGGCSTEGRNHGEKLRQTPPNPFSLLSGWGLGGIWVPLEAHQLLILLPELAEQPVAGGHCVVGELGDRKGRGPR